MASNKLGVSNCNTRLRQRRQSLLNSRNFQEEGFNEFTPLFTYKYFQMLVVLNSIMHVGLMIVNLVSLIHPTLVHVQSYL